MSDQINAAIQAAQAQAAASVALQAAGVGAIATTTDSAPPAIMQQGRAPALSMDDMNGGSITVDTWLGVNEDGFKVGKDKVLFDGDILVEIDLSAIAPNKSIKFGNPAVYFKTYDGVTASNGGSWAEAVAKANRADPKAREYRSCDVPMKVLEDVVVKKVVQIEAGMMAGNSLSTTNWGNWEKFYKEAVRAGLAGQAVKVTLGTERRTNANNNIWGVITFTLVQTA